MTDEQMRAAFELKHHDHANKGMHDQMWIVWKLACQDAVAAERERCVLVCKSLYTQGHHLAVRKAGEDCADAIRQGGEPPQPDTERLDWLDKNIFNRELTDWDGRLDPTVICGLCLHRKVTTGPPAGLSTPPWPRLRSLNDYQLYNSPHHSSGYRDLLSTFYRLGSQRRYSRSLSHSLKHLRVYSWSATT